MSSETKSARQVARELNIPASTLSLWIARGLIETQGGLLASGGKSKNSKKNFAHQEETND